ncbi:MAG: 50S ribosomal protein L13 [Candidatus Bipolaricaulota bacterium]|nr:50S ribosomal protein L13 [Candidatus Bipolaricaulota bacterium]MCS7275079.1 50S ribosomal protein L13 [Candidatus Bipolaricaulota bacterium]MDW8110407.1 50S ribosomal protein L13 [Candidatus Bipolaricaulota bacterium]MDW8329522.1 50S ribosomal protein L13 [Candidatus Bipolaricaulota bacterium]
MQRTTLMKKDDRRSLRAWVLVDARGETLGRLASRIAKILMGKHKPYYTPHVDVGDYVVVINAKEIKVTGKKSEQKIYYHYSRYPGGLRSWTFSQMIERHPTKPLEEAVRNMLPKTVLGRRMLKKLKIYPGPEHPHQIQNPTPIRL